MSELNSESTATSERESEVMLMVRYLFESLVTLRAAPSGYDMCQI